MKRLVAISILFCLTFLNVPRQLVHDCSDHGHTASSGLKKDKALDADFQIEQEDCFICTFDLGFYSTSEFNWVPVKQQIEVPYVAKRIELVTNESVSLNQLRGPPSMA